MKYCNGIDICLQQLPNSRQCSLISINLIFMEAFCSTYSQNILKANIHFLPFHLTYKACPLNLSNMINLASKPCVDMVIKCNPKFHEQLNVVWNNDYYLSLEYCNPILSKLRPLLQAIV